MPGATITMPWGDSELQIALPAGWRVLGVFFTYFALQTLKRCDVVFYAPTIHPRSASACVSWISTPTWRPLCVRQWPARRRTPRYWSFLMPA